jgi:hypothetical protein
VPVPVVGLRSADHETDSRGNADPVGGAGVREREEGAIA